MMSDRRLQIHQLINGNGDASSPSQHPSASGTDGAQVNGMLPSVYRFIENGRTYYAYQSDCIYPLPCDDEESNRLDSLHHALHEVALNGRRVVAEIDFHKPYRPQVLDVGYGDGIWCYEMALEHPGIDVVGIDLYNNHPPRDDPIPNASFLTPVDFTQPNWGLREGSFDLVRMSQLCGCVPDWPELYSNVYRHLRPGTGWVEHIEFDWMPRYGEEDGLPDSLKPLRDWWENLVRASNLLRRPIAYREDTEKLLRRTGFRDIGRKTIQMSPRTTLPDERDQELSRWCLSIMCGDATHKCTFEALSMSLFTRQLGLQPAYVASLCNDARMAYKTHRGPLYHNIHIWTARKPMS